MRKAPEKSTTCCNISNRQSSVDEERVEKDRDFE
jgi:hypothetical protein